MSKRQIQGPGSAPGFARGTSAAPIAKSHERAHSRNTLDPAKGQSPHPTPQKGKKGSGAE